MERRWVREGTLWLSALALVCWVVMFLAGNDVWHAAGRPDIWNLQGPPYQDVRAFTYAFYLLFVVLAGHVALTLAAIVGARRKEREMLRP